MSQIATIIEPTQNPATVEHEFVRDEDASCPICGKMCPNDSYCVNCGYVYDPVLRKYQTHDQIEAEKENQKLFQNADTKNQDELNKNAPRNQSKHQAKMAKIGREYKRQHGRVAEVGDIVRRKNGNGSYDKGSVWYIKTKHGWRSSPSKKRKPSKSQIKRACSESDK